MDIEKSIPEGAADLTERVIFKEASSFSLAFLMRFLSDRPMIMLLTSPPG